MNETKTVLLYKYRLRDGHAAYTFNHSIAVYGDNEWLASKQVELPEGGDIVAYFLGAGRITLCKAF